MDVKEQNILVLNILGVSENLAGRVLMAQISENRFELNLFRSEFWAIRNSGNPRFGRAVKS
ncbi:hypothetical protein BYT27DRAFT_7182734 [Phlegmacium glaucopus]|nr:hypothetical protein BYT27DRAFT_7182734 [Phlegmacium glaucopus]